MIRFACPGCGAVYSVTDDKAGKQGKCPKCQTPFTIPAAEAAPPPPPPAPAPKPPASSNPFADLSGDDDDRPKKKKPSKADLDDDAPPKKKPSKADLDDEDDDRPKKKPVKGRRDDDDEDDDPPPKKKPARRDDEDDDYDDRPKKKAAPVAGGDDDFAFDAGPKKKGKGRDDDEDDAPPPKKKPARRDDEDDDYDDRPKKKAKGRDDDYDDEDDRPRKKKGRGDDDYDDDYDDRPKKKKAPGILLAAAIIHIIAAALYIPCGGIALVGGGFVSAVGSGAETGGKFGGTIKPPPGGKFGNPDFDRNPFAELEKVGSEVKAVGTIWQILGVLSLLGGIMAIPAAVAGFTKKKWFVGVSYGTAGAFILFILIRLITAVMYTLMGIGFLWVITEVLLPIGYIVVTLMAVTNKKVKKVLA